ncbi:hypothetical protein NLJ89_g9774 [Agrocybe chaxingu]|uniref:Conidiation-specific protein 6 n=1 Tax=Agrocybe chaxingu TaxID=84603 RepID=A0A9W8MRI2_9AGAR|nr:hypothetical protein NLJ89_g9774 [Agrocybe chaxingu]
MSSDPSRVAAGYKAAIHNPRVSEETRERVQEKLDSLKGGVGAERSSSGEQFESEDATAGKNAGNVMGGYKATLKNPNVSAEAKENAREILEGHGAL